MTTESLARTVNTPVSPQTATNSGMQPVGEKRKAAIHKAAVEFQSLFVEMMLKSMRETVGQDKLTGGGHGEEVYGSLLDREYATAVSRRGGLGLSEIIEQQLLAQEGGSKKAIRNDVGNTRDEKTAKTENIEVYHENHQ